MTSKCLPEGDLLELVKNKSLILRAHIDTIHYRRHSCILYVTLYIFNIGNVHVLYVMYAWTIFSKSIDTKMTDILTEPPLSPRHVFYFTFVRILSEPFQYIGLTRCSYGKISSLNYIDLATYTIHNLICLVKVKT
jgi:hypothetical protein